MAWNNGQVMEPGVYVNEPKPKTTKKGSSGVQSGALSISMDDLLQALTGSRQGVVSEQPLPKQTATKEPKETALKLPGLSSEMGGLAQALVGARRNRAQRYQATDPWSIGQSVIEDPGLAEGLGMKLDKPWKQGLFNIAQNLIGGYVGGKARQGLEEYDRPFMQAIQGAAQTGDFSRLPISSEDDPTGTLQMALALSGAEDRKKRNEKLMDSGMQQGPNGLEFMPGYLQTQAQLAQLKDPYGQAEFAMKQAQAARDQAEFYQKQTENQSKRIAGNFDNETKLRTEFQTQPEYKNFSTMYSTLDSLLESANDKSKVSDLDFVYGVMKTLDPNSVVRESEGQMVIDSQSVPDSILGRIKAMTSGGQSLTPEVRQELLNLAGNRYDAAYKLFDKKRKDYTTIGQQYGLNTDNLVLFPEAVPFEQLRQRKSGAQQGGGDLPPLFQGMPAETQNYLKKIFGNQTQLPMDELLNRTMGAESNGNVNALSPKGAQGAYQFMPATAREMMRKMGLNPQAYDPTDADLQRKLAEFYINENMGKFGGDQRLAMAAYNWGPGNLQEAIAKNPAPPGMKKQVNQKTGQVRLVPL